MREFQAKKRIRHILYSRWIIILMILAVLFLAKATWNVYQKYSESADNAEVAEQELEKLSERQKLLSTEIARLSTEKGIEEEIRNKYTVSKPGEELLVIIDDKATTTASTTKPEGWWMKFKKFFK